MMGQRFVVAALICGVALAAGSAAHAQDAELTCKATGKGTSWSLAVTASSMPLGGFVAGFPGGTITDFSIDGYSGQPDTTGLPPGMSNGMFTQIPSGRGVVLQVTTSTAPIDPFNVAFINQAQTGYGTTFSCPFGSGPDSGPGSGGAHFTLAVADFNADGSPDLVVGSPGPGIFIVEQVFPGRSQSATRAKVMLVKSQKVVVKKSGKVTIALQPTAAGKAVLAQKGRFTASMKVRFTASDGQSTSKTTQVTFTKG